MGKQGSLSSSKRNQYPVTQEERPGVTETTALETKENKEFEKFPEPPSAASEEIERGQWTGQFDFLMSMIAYAVGLGNVWRFPYLCFKNGGGSFLVVYFIFFALAAVPIFMMEVTIGQYLQRGAMEMWKMCPLFKGVGIGNVMISFMCVAYFCVIVSWAIFYMISSVAWTFPWETCDNWWNDNNICTTGKQNASVIAAINRNLSNFGLKTETAVEQFWERRVLMQTNSISEFGGIQWELLGIMLFSWLIVYFALWKGITNARKFVYFCALFPYFLIFVLLARGLTLPGAATGISFYLTPNMTKLLETTVWKDAGTQVFYSYGVGFGTLIALGSHNKFNHNCFRDAILMCCINGSTSILAGFAVFSILGFMSVETGIDIAEIVKPGVGLAFLAYPEVASKLPLKQVWAILFFLMITILGLDSQVCMLEGLFTALEDTFPTLLRKHRKISLGVTCLFFFILGIPMVSYAGSYWLTLFDAYGASGIALLFVVFFEVVGLAWGFGARRVRNALHEMLGFRPSVFWEIIWKFISPLITAVLFVFCIVMYVPLKYPGGENFPFWAQMFGFFLSSCSMICIPGYAIYYLFCSRSQLSLKDRFIEGIRVPDHLITTGHRPVPYASPEEMDFIDFDKKRTTNYKSPHSPD
uniref:Transporter n=1 Tax=Acrobeloides nanus TaxID=290746 RepID=A0A914C425_9BILA